METLYRGFEISQPKRFFRHKHTFGNGRTSITVRTHQVTSEAEPKILKTYTFARYSTKELEAAMEKARTFIDDLHLEGKRVEVLAGKYKGCNGIISEVKRRKINNKHLLFVTVKLDPIVECKEEAPPAITLKAEEFKTI